MMLTLVERTSPPERDKRLPMTSSLPFPSPTAPHPLATDAALRRKLTALARRWLGHATDAEDMVQDVYVRTAGGQLPPDDHGVHAWLVTVLRNLCIDTVRRRSHFAGLLEEVDAQVQLQSGPAQWQAEQAQSVDAALVHLVAHLAPEDAAAVLLHEVFDMGHAELGALTGRSEAASRQRLHRALRRVRNEPLGELQRAEDEAVLALCRLAMAHHDPAGLVALLRSTAPVAMTAVVHAGHRLAREGQHRGGHAQLQMVNGRLVLAVHLGTQFLCLLPLGPSASAELAGQAESALPA